MHQLTKAACLAALAVSGWCGIAAAQTQPPAVGTGLPPEEPTASTAPPKPLMALLNQVGVGQALDEANISIYGHAQASWTYSFNDPPNNAIAGRSFDFENEDLTFNQLSLTVERPVDVTEQKFDVGFRFENMYGGDARFLHSNGLLDHRGFPLAGNASDEVGPDEQYDLSQLYVDVAIPVGNGLRLRGGKFITLGGYEVVNPTGRPIYSPGLIFNYTLPFSHTGLLATYALDPDARFVVDFGVTRGWDQALEDNNDAVDVVGRLSWVATDEFALFATAYLGPQLNDDESHYRGVFDLVATYQYADNLSFAANFNYGYDAGANTLGNKDPQWVALEGWTVLMLNEYLNVNGRLGWINDDQGSRGIGTDLYSGTLGLGVKPIPSDNLWSNLMIRPELRLDYAEQSFFDGGDDHYQVTFATDVVFAF
ncbi:MAG TPA: outer membrane beta-barrel protein [Tepidisphaeraceae bacterium]|nr:outer membrane beta-barrel protein [Tepidisphaeraceae bacterium]